MAVAPQPHALSIGVDVGQKADPTAYCVAAHLQRAALPAFLSDRPEDAELRRVAQAMRDRGELPAHGPTETIFEVRELRRLPLHMTYPDMAAAIAAMTRAVALRSPLVPRLYLDATGVGTAFLDLLRALHPPAVIVPVYFTHGDRLAWRREGQRPALNRRDTRPLILSLGKAWLVTRLQALFEGRRVRLSAANPEAAAVRQELLDYEIRPGTVDNDKYGAFRTGAHDDLVTALGLATLTEQGPSAERPERTSVPILPGVL
jgi:hypothetical protein